MKQYLDVNGGKYLTTKMKTYVDDKVKNLPAGGTGTVDLTNYYTKKETDDLLKNITSGGTGTAGKDGVGVSSIKLVNYELIVALTDGTEHNLGNVRGEKGDKGATGAKGADGRNGIDGAKGTDGVSPTVSVTATTNGHTVAITDVNGTQSFEVLNGKDGKDGASGGSSDGGGSTSGGEIYSNNEIAIGTWIDGKTIYRSIVDIQLPANSKSGAPEICSFKHGLSIDATVNERMFTPTYNIKSFFNNLGFATTNLAKISSITTLKDYLIRVAVTPTEIMVDYGYWWNDTKLKCIIDYTKK